MAFKDAFLFIGGTVIPSRAFASNISRVVLLYLSTFLSVISINWTGSGSYLLSQQRRKQNTLRQRNHRHVSVEVDQDDEWYTNSRGGQGLPPEDESPPLPEHTGSEVEEEKSPNSEHGDRNEERDDAQRLLRHPHMQNDTRVKRIGAPQHASFGELRRWLLDQPDWVGAKQKRKAEDAEHPDQRTSDTNHPKPAPILDSSSHSKKSCPDVGDSSSKRTPSPSPSSA